MRAVLRVLAGLALVAAGILSLTGGVLAWSVGGQRADEPGFLAELAPVQTEGYAIVLPDVAGVLSRHGAARLLGDGRVTITVRSASTDPADLVTVALVPAGDALRHLSGTARTDIVAVGYATGVQPVQAVDVSGGALPASAPWETADPGPGITAQTGRQVTVTVDVPTQAPVALVVHRPDSAASLQLSITVGFAPASWGTATTVLLIAGALGTLAGLGVLVLRRPWVDVWHPMVVDDPVAAPVRVVPPRAAARTPRWWRLTRRGHAPEPRQPDEDRIESPYVHTAT
jgi:hypothetical protein